MVLTESSASPARSTTAGVASKLSRTKIGAGVAWEIVRKPRRHSARPLLLVQGIDNTEIIDTIHARRAPMVPVDSSLRL